MHIFKANTCWSMVQVWLAWLNTNFNAKPNPNVETVIDRKLTSQYRQHYLLAARWKWNAVLTSPISDTNFKEINHSLNSNLYTSQNTLKITRISFFHPQIILGLPTTITLQFITNSWLIRRPWIPWKNNSDLDYHWIWLIWAYWVRYSF